MAVPEQIGAYQADTAREILRVVRQLQASGLLGPGIIEAIVKRARESSELPVFFTNVSGEAIPPYACMQVVDTVEIGPQNFCEVDKPQDTTGEAGAFIFNGHREIAIGGQGCAQAGRLVRAVKSGGTPAAGDRWQPVVNDWEIEEGDGPFIMAGEDDIETDVVKVFVDPQGGGAILAYTPSGGIPGKTGTHPTFTLGSATCKRVELSGLTATVTGDDVTVCNSVSGTIPGSIIIQCKRIAGQWLADVADCPGVTPAEGYAEGSFGWLFGSDVAEGSFGWLFGSELL